MLRDSVVAVLAVLRERPRAIPLAMTIMTKTTHGFPFLSHMIEYGAPLGCPKGLRSCATRTDLLVLGVKLSVKTGMKQISHICNMSLRNVKAG